MRPLRPTPVVVTRRWPRVASRPWVVWIYDLVLVGLSLTILWTLPLPDGGWVRRVNAHVWLVFAIDLALRLALSDDRRHFLRARLPETLARPWSPGSVASGTPCGGPSSPPRPWDTETWLPRAQPAGWWPSRCYSWDRHHGRDRGQRGTSSRLADGAWWPLRSRRWPSRTERCPHGHAELAGRTSSTSTGRLREARR